MVTPSEAEHIVLSHVFRLSTEDCPLLQAHGRILRRPICADRPMPPFDRVTMDGYALRSTAANSGRRQFRVQSLQAAGMIPHALGEEDACIEVATGAALPSGTDLVVPYEETERTREPSPGAEPGAFQPYTITVTNAADLAAGRNVHRQGSDHAAGDELVATGTRLGGGEIAVAASCGYAHVKVAVRPLVAVVATGDELVEVDTPHLAPQQIRKSNDYALRAALLRSGLAGRVDRFHLRDLRSEIDRELRRLLAEFDVVILTGGVSKGRFDHLPQALAALGVQPHLRGVAQRPGKPFWFGTSSRRTPVFALPGNPVSAYTCLHRYVLPALQAMTGAAPALPEYAVLRDPVKFTPALAYLLPVVVTSQPDGRRIAAPAPFNTSGDLGGLVGTTGFVELPAEQTDFAAGAAVRYWAWT